MCVSKHSVNIYSFVLAIIMFSLSVNVNAAKSTTEKLGDIFQILIPLSAYTTTFYLDDTEGRNQFYKSFLTTVVVTQGLKYVTHKQRPENNGDNSFPSGHTSAAFQGAAFIQRRYGWKYGLPSYALASFVGYSRMEGESDKHYPSDVIAGAAIGILSSYYFTTEYKGVIITPSIYNGTAAINISMEW